MPDALSLACALLLSTCGMAWLALAMKTHWRQVGRESEPSARTALVLRCLGALALALSFWLCLAVDHISMASLVWIMSLAAAALIVALTLTWRPRVLACLLGGSKR